MRDDFYFRGIRQTKVEAGGYDFLLPVFHYRSRAFGITALADRRATDNMVMSPRLKAAKLPMSRTILFFIAAEHEDSDIGSYNEFMAIAPVFLSGAKSASRLVGSWRNIFPSYYVLYRLVNRPKAASLYRDVINAPVIVADVDIETQGRFHRCRVAKDGQLVIIMEVPRREGRIDSDFHADVFSAHSNRLLRNEIAGKIYEVAPGAGYKSKFVMGGSYIAKDFRQLKLGKPLASWQSPTITFLQTATLQSLPARLN